MPFHNVHSSIVKQPYSMDIKSIKTKFQMSQPIQLLSPILFVGIDKLTNPTKKIHRQIIYSPTNYLQPG